MQYLPINQSLAPIVESMATDNSLSASDLVWDLDPISFHLTNFQPYITSAVRC